MNNFAIGATGATRATAGIALANDTRNAYKRHVVFHSDYAEAEAGTLTLWTLHTYLSDLADATPYMLVMAPTSEAGKSRIFDVARCLVWRPIVVADPTPAALYSSIDPPDDEPADEDGAHMDMPKLPPTLMIDEADMLRESQGLRAVLNTGFEPGTPIRRFKATYHTFCPKIFTGIAGERPPLTEMTLSRCVQIPMRRKAPHEHADNFSKRRTPPTLVPLRERIEHWTALVRDEIAEADPDLPSELSDRQQDAWAPLLAIADAIGGEWAKDARKWAVTLFEAVPKPPDPAVQILSDVKRVLDRYEGLRIPTATLAELRNALDLREYDEDLSANQLGRRLAGFGIHPVPTPFRMAGRNSPIVRGYVIRTKRGDRYEYTNQWADTFTRYRINGGKYDAIEDE